MSFFGRSALVSTDVRADVPVTARHTIPLPRHMAQLDALRVIGLIVLVDESIRNLMCTVTHLGIACRYSVTPWASNQRPLADAR